MFACPAFVVRMLYIPVTSHIGHTSVFLESPSCSKVMGMSKVLRYTLALFELTQLFLLSTGTSPSALSE
jgi:hypothetical protein